MATDVLERDEEDDRGIYCPEHNVKFATIARTPNGPRVCPHGETWRSYGGVLIRDGR